MHEAAKIILQEHRAIAAVLHGLLYLVRDVAEKNNAPDFRVLRAMLDYIVAFPEKLHHPKEDRYLFKAIRARSPAANQVLAELEAEHVRGDELIRRLQETLIAYEKDARANARAFRQAAEDYAEFHWKHMRREEDVILPLAENVLTESDWKEIGAAFKQNDDPLFGLKPKEEFDQLFRRVLELAPPPIGLGPGPGHGA